MKTERKNKFSNTSFYDDEHRKSSKISTMKTKEEKSCRDLPFAV